MTNPVDDIVENVRASFEAVLTATRSADADGEYSANTTRCNRETEEAVMAYGKTVSPEKFDIDLFRSNYFVSADITTALLVQRRIILRLVANSGLSGLD